MKFEPRDEYKKYYYRWLQAADFSRGGRHVLAPEHYVQDAIDISPIYDTSDDGVRTQTGWDRVAIAVNSYLHKNPNERLDEFDQRCRRAWHYPIYRELRDIFTGGVLRKPPNRNWQDPIFSILETDADLSGDGTGHIGSFMREVLTKSIDFGRSHVLVDLTSPINGASVRSHADELSAGIRPYCRLLTPLDIIDWHSDGNNRFDWIIIRESAEMIRDPGEKFVSAINYRVWHKDYWELYREKIDQRGNRIDIESIQGGPNPIGRVPIITHYSAEKTMDCESPLSSTIDFDRAIFNRFSELNHMERNAGFPIMTLPNDSVGAATNLVVGPSAALTYPPDSKPPAFISPDASHATGYYERTKQMMIAHSETVHGYGDFGARRTEIRSNAMSETVTDPRRNLLRYWAETTEAVENGIYQMASYWYQNKHKPPVTHYSRDIKQSIMFQMAQSLLILKDVPFMPDYKMKKLGDRLADNLIEELQ